MHSVRLRLHMLFRQVRHRDACGRLQLKQPVSCRTDMRQQRVPAAASGMLPGRRLSLRRMPGRQMHATGTDEQGHNGPADNNTCGHNGAAHTVHIYQEVALKKWREKRNEQDVCLWFFTSINK